MVQIKDKKDYRHIMLLIRDAIKKDGGLADGAIFGDTTKKEIFMTLRLALGLPSFGRQTNFSEFARQFCAPGIVVH